MTNGLTQTYLYVYHYSLVCGLSKRKNPLKFFMNNMDMYEERICHVKSNNTDSKILKLAVLTKTRTKNYNKC